MSYAHRKLRPNNSCPFVLCTIFRWVKINQRFIRKDHQVQALLVFPIQPKRSEVLLQSKLWLPGTSFACLKEWLTKGKEWSCELKLTEPTEGWVKEWSWNESDWRYFMSGNIKNARPWSSCWKELSNLWFVFRATDLVFSEQSSSWVFARCRFLVLCTKKRVFHPVLNNWFSN